MYPADDDANGRFSHEMISPLIYRLALIVPTGDPIQILQEFLPAKSRAAKCLRLVFAETRLLHAQMGSSSRRRQRERHHAFQMVGGIGMGVVPGIGQRLVRLDGANLATQHSAPVAA